jgi:hypothetical protein
MGLKTIIPKSSIVKAVARKVVTYIMSQISVALKISATDYIIHFI